MPGAPLSEDLRRRQQRTHWEPSQSSPQCFEGALLGCFSSCTRHWRGARQRISSRTMSFLTSLQINLCSRSFKYQVEGASWRVCVCARQGRGRQIWKGGGGTSDQIWAVPVKTFTRNSLQKPVVEWWGGISWEWKQGKVNREGLVSVCEKQYLPHRHTALFSPKGLLVWHICNLLLASCCDVHQTLAKVKGSSSFWQRCSGLGDLGTCCGFFFLSPSPGCTPPPPPITCCKRTQVKALPIRAWSRIKAGGEQQWESVGLTRNRAINHDGALMCECLSPTVVGFELLLESLAFSFPLLKKCANQRFWLDPAWLRTLG